MYEHHRTRPAPLSRFMRRLLGHFLAAAALVGISLLGGMWGYQHYEGLGWREAFLNTAMLLGGEGPVDPPRTNAGKVFAGLYALYAGLVFLVVASLLLAPMIHRLLHRLHWEEER